MPDTPFPSPVHGVMSALPQTAMPHTLAPHPKLHPRRPSPVGRPHEAWSHPSCITLMPPRGIGLSSVLPVTYICPSGLVAASTSRPGRVAALAPPAGCAGSRACPNNILCATYESGLLRLQPKAWCGMRGNAGSRPRIPRQDGPHAAGPAYRWTHNAQ